MSVPGSEVAALNEPCITSMSTLEKLAVVVESMSRFTMTDGR